MTEKRQALEGLPKVFTGLSHTKLLNALLSWEFPKGKIQWPAETDAGPAKRAGFNGNPAAERVGDRVNDGKAKSTAAGCAITARVEPYKRFEYAFTFVKGNAWAVILNLQISLGTIKPQADP